MTQDYKRKEKEKIRYEFKYFEWIHFVMRN